MHRIDSAGNVSGAFSGGTPGVSQATVISSAWLNDVQGELVTVIEGLGGVLVKGSNQLLARLNAKYGRLDLANTWAGNQSFGGTVGVTGTTTLSGPLNANGATAVNAALTVAPTSGNTAGTTSTGAGTGSGVVATGGASSGAGVTATGGASNGNGVVATGTGTGLGVSATGGIVGTSATVGSSTLTYSPVYRFTNSAITSTSGNQHPLHSVQWSAGGQTAGLTLKTKNTGTVTDWMNVDVGFSYQVGSEGSAVTGAGGELYFSVNGLKVYRWLTDPATSSAARNALSLMNGYLSLDNVTAPNSTVAVKNAVTPKNITKVTASLQTSGTGTVTVLDAFNLTSATLSGGNILLTFAQAFSSANYQITFAIDDGLSGMWSASYNTKQAGSVLIKPWQVVSGAFSALSFASSALRFDVTITGAQ